MPVRKKQRPLGAHPVYWAVDKAIFPSDWQVRAVSTMATTFKGKLPKKVLDSQTEGSKQYLLMEGLRGGRHVYTEEINLPSVIKDDTIVIADGSKSGFAVRGFGGILGSTLLALRAKEGINPSYLYHLMSSLFPFLGSTTIGSAIPHLDQDLLLKLCLAIPLYEEQCAIVRVLDSVDTTIERTREAIECAGILDHSLLHELLDNGLIREEGKKTKRPSHWQIKRVDEVAEVGSGVTLGKDLSGFKYVELPYLRVANVQDGHLDLSDVKTVKVRLNEVERYRLEPGDVLMTEGGDIDKLGRGTIWEGQIPDCLHQNHIFRVRANRELLDPRFFAYVVESDIAKSYFMRVAKRTTNLASTNKTQVRAFRFPVPPVPEQKQIADIVSAAKATLRGYIQKEEALNQLKRSLMHDLLTGKVRANNLTLETVSTT
jgi:type I restriction enzyme S subunit